MKDDRIYLRHIVEAIEDIEKYTASGYAAFMCERMQQEFSIDRVPVRDRDAGGMVMTSRRIEFIGAGKPSDWDDSLTGPRGRLSHFT